MTSVGSDLVAAGSGLSAADRFTLRVAVAATLGFAIALSLGWPLAFLPPMLAVKMLPGIPAFPTLIQGLLMPIMMWVGTTLSLMIVSLLGDAPIVELLVLGLVLFFTYFFKRLGAPAVIALLLQIGICIVALYATASLETAHFIAEFLQKGTIVAAATVFISHLLVPAPPLPAQAPPVQPPRFSPISAARIALADMLVLFPLLVHLLLGSRIQNFVMLMMTINIISELSPTRSRAIGMSMIVGNTMGGLLAVLAQQVVFLADSLLFFLLIVFLAMLWFGGGLARGGRTYDIFRLGGGTFTLILGIAIAPMPGGSEESYFMRIVHILLAGAYAAIALALVAPLRGAAPATRPRA